MRISLKKKCCAAVLMTAGAVMSLTTGCAVGSLRVNSTPPAADVYIAYEGEQPNKIGQTPLNLDSRLIDEGRGRYVSVMIKKDGYQTEALLVPTGLMRSSLDISSKLEEFKLPLQCQDQTSAVEKIGRGIANVQSLVKTNALGEAQNKLMILIDEYPNISVLHDLLGNVHYINKNLDGALASYQKSLNLDPNNIDTQRMVNKIRTITGVRTPAGSSGGGQ
jgi:hypothetical protein